MFNEKQLNWIKVVVPGERTKLSDSLKEQNQEE